MNNRRKKQYPAKTSVNLLYRKETNASPARILLAGAVFAAVLSVFYKFAGIVRLAAAQKALREAEDIEEALADVKRGNSDYEDVLRKYQHYYFSAADNQNGGAGTYVDCQKVFGLLEAELLHKAGIQTVNLAGNVLTVDLTKTNLESASAIAQSLEKNEIVETVAVSAANRQQKSEGSTVYLSIVLKTEKDSRAG